MKLSGPSGPGVRIVLGPNVRTVINGVFPPERAAQFQEDADEIAKLAQPHADAALAKIYREMDNALLYGNPHGPVHGQTPRGILNARSPRGLPWIEPKRERAASDVLERLGLIVRPRYDGITLT